MYAARPSTRAASLCVPVPRGRFAEAAGKACGTGGVGRGKRRRRRGITSKERRTSRIRKNCAAVVVVVVLIVRGVVVVVVVRYRYQAGKW